MKFICRSCEAFMAYQEIEVIKEDSVGITFSCSQCGVKVAMVTNSGETQMVHALGVKLGGRTEPPPPLELTRATLKTSDINPLPSSFPSPLGGEGRVRGGDAQAELTKNLGKCPFANVVAGMKETLQETKEGEITWTKGAEERLEKVPEFIRSFAKMALEGMAKEKNLSLIDETLMDQAKTKFMSFG